MRCRSRIACRITPVAGTFTARARVSPSHRPFRRRTITHRVLRIAHANAAARAAEHTQVGADCGVVITCARRLAWLSQTRRCGDRPPTERTMRRRTRALAVERPATGVMRHADAGLRHRHRDGAREASQSAVDIVISSWSVGPNPELGTARKLNLIFGCRHGRSGWSEAKAVPPSIAPCLHTNASPSASGQMDGRQQGRPDDKRCEGGQHEGRVS